MDKEKAKYISKILKAYSEGEVIQARMKFNGRSATWVTIDSKHDFDFIRSEYRIKPEPKYRPYANAEEFLNAQKEHGMYLIPKNKNDIAKLPVVVEPKKILMFWEKEDSKLAGYMYLDLLIYWLHQDGAPCGILEECET